MRRPRVSGKVDEQVGASRRLLEALRRSVPPRGIVPAMEHDVGQVLMDLVPKDSSLDAVSPLLGRDARGMRPAQENLGRESGQIVLFDQENEQWL